MINIILSGCFGKMGKVVTRMAGESDDFKVVWGIDAKEEESSFPVTNTPPEDFSGADILIDFSNPSLLKGSLDYAVKCQIPAIIATTGMGKEHLDLIHGASEKIPVFFSANMSLGVNLVVELCKKAAEVLAGGYDIEIIERHHNQKIDAPSGTAFLIADAIKSVLPFSANYEYDRHAKREKRSKSEIGMHSIRGGNIVGDHEVIFAGTDEIIEIKHHAASREVFATGALRAAKFLVSVPSPGLYSMSDMLNTSPKKEKKDA